MRCIVIGNRVHPAGAEALCQHLIKGRGTWRAYDESGIGKTDVPGSADRIGEGCDRKRQQSIIPTHWEGDGLSEQRSSGSRQFVPIDGYCDSALDVRRLMREHAIIDMAKPAGRQPGIDPATGTVGSRAGASPDPPRSDCSLPGCQPLGGQCSFQGFLVIETLGNKRTTVEGDPPPWRNLTGRNGRSPRAGDGRGCSGIGQLMSGPGADPCGGTSRQAPAPPLYGHPGMDPRGVPVSINDDPEALQCGEHGCGVHLCAGHGLPPTTRVLPAASPPVSHRRGRQQSIGAIGRIEEWHVLCTKWSGSHEECQDKTHAE